ncbi:MAG: oligosaccharide flippase family protein [Alphaproteobacteria bacterium]|nr:oligosaccharide flippase family protein [Alphaproteobacteria bacterium]
MGKVSRRDVKAGATTLLVGQVVQVIIAFAANLVLVRYIAPEGFGRFAITLATASLIVSLLSIRVNSLIIRVPDGELTRHLEELYFSYLTIETFVALIAGLVWIALAGNAGSLEFFLVVLVCVQHWIHQNKSFFERGMPYVRLGLIETGCSVFANLATVCAVFAGAGVVALYIREFILTVTLFVSLAVLGGLTWRRLRWLSRTEWSDIIREGRGIWLDGVLEGSYQRIAILLAGLVGGDRGAGFFFQAQRLAILPNQLLSPLVGRLAVNLFGRENRPERRKQLRNRQLAMLVPILVLATVLTVLFAVPAVTWVFGATWIKSADLLVAFAGVIMFTSLFEILKSYCFITQSMRTLFLGRVAQYLMLGALPILVGIGLVGDQTTALAISISLGWAVAFLVVGGVLLRNRA